MFAFIGGRCEVMRLDEASRTDHLGVETVGKGSGIQCVRRVVGVRDMVVIDHLVD